MLDFRGFSEYVTIQSDGPVKTHPCGKPNTSPHNRSVLEKKNYPGKPNNRTGARDTQLLKNTSGLKKPAHILSLI